MSYTITSLGGGKTLEIIFNALAIVLSFSPQGMGATLMRLSGLIGVTWVLITSMVRQSILPSLQWFIWFLVVVNVLLVPRTTVYIRDPITYHQHLQKIDNVPVVLAILGSLISDIGHGLTEKLEQVFTLPDYLPYHQTGMVFGSRLISESKTFRIEDPLFNQNMQRFVQQCVTYDAMIGHKYTLKDLKTSRDIWGLVSSRASPLLGFLYKSDNFADNKIVTCREGAARLNARWNAEIQEAAKKWGRHFFPELNETQARNAFLEKLPQSYTLLSNISLGASELLQQEMMINVIQTASHNKTHELGAAANYAGSKAALQQRSSYEVAGEMARTALPVMKNVFEAIAYGSFVFIFPLMTLPNGYQTLSMYVGILVWIQLWAPLYAILNLIMIVTTRYKGIACAGLEGLTMGTSQGLANLNSDMAALTGWLSFSVPAIAYMMVKGGASSFVNIANHLGSAAQSAISSSAQEVASGNISLSNFSQSNQNMYNQSAFQTRRSADHASGQFSHNLADGAIQITMAEGKIFGGGSGKTISSLGTEIWSSNNFTKQLTQASMHEQSLTEAAGREIARGLSSASRQATDLLKRMSHAENRGKSYQLDESVSNNKSLTNTLKFGRNLQQTFGVSEQEALQLVLSAAVAASYKMTKTKDKDDEKTEAKDEAAAKFFDTITEITIGANAQGSYSKDVGRRVTFEDIGNVGKEQGYTETIDSISRATANEYYGQNETNDSSLSRNLSASLEEIKSHRDSYQLHHQQAERLSQGANTAQSSSFDSRVNLTQEALEFIANQRSMNGKSIMGLEYARKILDATAGPLAERKAEYIEAFQEQRTRCALNQFIDKNMFQAEALTKEFMLKKAFITPPSEHKQHAKNANEIDRQGEQDNLRIDASPTTETKIKVEDLTAQTQKITQAQESLAGKYQGMLEARKKAGEKNLFKKLLGNTVPENNPEKNE